MDTELSLLQKLKDKELEKYGAKFFNNIGLTCCSNLAQVRLNDITSGFSEDEHIEFDYIIPYNGVCLIGEITAREDKRDIKKKYDKFIKQVNIIKNLEFTENLWINLGVKQENIRLFREIEDIKAFFITIKKEKYDLTLGKVQDIPIFHKSDFLRIIEYSKSIGEWTKNYFLHNFNIRHTNNTAISIYQKENLLIRNKNKKVSGQDSPLADLYTLFQYSKFWAGFVNLLCIFIEEGLSWTQIKQELETIKSNLMKLQNVDLYNQPLFNPQSNHIPDPKYSPTQVGTFLNKNRHEAYSIQNIK